MVDINDDENLSVTLGVAFQVLRELINLHIMELGRLLYNATRVFHAINSGWHLTIRGSVCIVEPTLVLYRLALGLVSFS